MPVDRKTYKVPFSKDNPSQWTCPSCNKGILNGKKGSFVFNELKESIKAHQENWTAPEDTQYTYSCQFICTNPTCGETVVNVGIGSVDVEPTYNSNGEPDKWDYYEYFEPKYFIPHLNIFEIAENTPITVKESIHESFKLFFTSPSSSSNHLRVALEKLLDSLKIKRFGTNKGRRIPISLHKRIDLLPNKYSDFKDLFWAVKWLGNAGSHSDDITIDDVMDAYDIFEIVLDELFDNKTQKTRKLAKRINKTKARRKQK